MKPYSRKSTVPPPASRNQILLTLRALSRMGVLSRGEILHASTAMSREAYDALAVQNERQDVHLARLDGDNRLADARKRARAAR